MIKSRQKWAKHVLTQMLHVQEYLGSNNVSECRHCLHKLAVPFFHHEVVKQSLLLAIEDSNQQGALLALLKQLNASGEIRDSQVSRVSFRSCLNLLKHA